MGILESKKIIILRILSVLEKYSDIDHPLTNLKIMEYLRSDYGIECERKTVGRNISFLKDGGYPIASTTKGAYLGERLFEESELRLLIDSILASRHINDRYSKELIDKLNSLGGVHFKERNKNIRVSDWGKCDNFDFFLNIEVIDEAIDKNNQIELIYNSYGIDKKLHPCKEYSYIVNPYQMLINNQRYYLIGNVDKYQDITIFRIDRITNIRILDTPLKPVSTLPEYGEGIDAAKISCESPYMYTGAKEYVEMTMQQRFINDVIDWFGKDFRVEDLGHGMIKVCLKANLEAMKYWALQYGKNIEIISPESLRNDVISIIDIMSKKYSIK